MVKFNMLNFIVFWLMKILLKLRDAIVTKCRQKKKSIYKDIFNDCIIMKSEKSVIKLTYLTAKMISVLIISRNCHLKTVSQKMMKNWLCILAFTCSLSMTSKIINRLLYKIVTISRFYLFFKVFYGWKKDHQETVYYSL